MKPRKRNYAEDEDGSEDYCRLCGYKECHCDDIYEQWRDRELEKELDDKD
jgi:hypothetical protein